MSFIQFIQWIGHYTIVVMFALFSLIVAATYWPGRKRAIEHHGRIVLDDDRQGASGADQN